MKFTLHTLIVLVVGIAIAYYFPQVATMTFGKVFPKS